MFGWLKKKKKKAEAPKSAYAGIVERFLEKVQCPCCEMDDAFLEGPCGGESMNTMCRFCGTRLNFTYALGITILDWTHGPVPTIWGGTNATKFPSAGKVALVQTILEDK